MANNNYQPQAGLIDDVIEGIAGFFSRQRKPTRFVQPVHKPTASPTPTLPATPVGPILREGEVFNPGEIIPYTPKPWLTPGFIDEDTGLYFEQFNYELWLKERLRDVIQRKRNRPPSQLPPQHYDYDPNAETWDGESIL